MNVWHETLLDQQEKFLDQLTPEQRKTMEPEFRHLIDLAWEAGKEYAQGVEDGPD